MQKGDMQMCRKETNSGENILAPAAIGKECWWAGLGGVGRREGFISALALSHHQENHRALKLKFSKD